MAGAENAVTLSHRAKDLLHHRQQPVLLIEDADSTNLAMVQAVVAGGACRHPDLPGAHLKGQAHGGQVQPTYCLIQDQAAIDTDTRDALRNEPCTFDRRVLMGLDDDRRYASVPGSPREFQVIEATAIHIRSAMHMQIHSSLEIVGEMTHAATP